MKVVPVLAAALVIYIAIPGSNQGRGKKPKPKFCMGADGNRYKKGGSYEDKEACISYTCTKSRNKFKMKMEEIQCVGNKNNQIQKTIEDLNKHIPQPRKEGEPFVLKRTWCFWLGCANAHYYKPCCKLWQPYCKGLICRRKQKRCNSGWALVDTGCYRVVNVATFEQARAFCEDDRGSLVEITSQIEQDTLAKFYDDSLINGWVWLGAQKTQEDEWRWISSGEKMIFNSWGSGEPNNVEGEENCLVWDGNESWKAVRCNDTDTNFKAICEEHKEPLPQTTDGAESVTVAPSIKPPKPCYCGIPNQRLRIVGGKKAEKHEYPWQVALVDGNDNLPFCSGSLISSETVLTAAHCTEDKEAKDISVLVGEHDVTDKSDGQRKNKVKQIIQNNLYNFETIDYDISLVILMNPVIWSKKAKPICLPKQSTNYENVKGIVSGWGTREHNGLNSDTLLETEVMTMTNKECTTNKEYKTSQITSSMICASGDGRDACHGDSGGPLVSLETGGYYSVIGVVSWGKGCADQDSPGVYSRVAHQMAWITENMVGQSCPIPQSTSGNLGSVFLIAGGYSAERDIELYHPTIENFNCPTTLPPLKDDWVFHISFYHNQTIHLCGGEKTKSSCISYSRKMSDWKTHSLSPYRISRHSSVVLRNILYLIGGVDSNDDFIDSVSTPVPLTDTPVLTTIHSLSNAYKGWGHCSMEVDQETLLIIGGYYQGSSLSTVTQYNINTHTAKALPSLRQERYGHACIMVQRDNKKWVIVTAGYFTDKLDTTEILELGQSTWISAGRLNVKRTGVSMVDTERGIMVIGGWSRISSVELMDWSTKIWSLVQPSIKIGRHHYTATEIPLSMFDCVVECKNGGDLLSIAPDNNMALCKDIKSNTCEKDLENLCPVGWHLCNPKEFNNRNDGWSYTTPALTFGQMYCRPNGGTSPFLITKPLNQDDPGNCGNHWSSRPGCDLWDQGNTGHACNNKGATALCCAQSEKCGNGAVDSVEEECDDGNDSELDDCLDSCAWRTPAQHGLNYCQ